MAFITATGVAIAASLIAGLISSVKAENRQEVVDTVNRAVNEANAIFAADTADLTKVQNFLEQRLSKLGIRQDILRGAIQGSVRNKRTLKNLSEYKDNIGKVKNTNRRLADVAEEQRQTNLRYNKTISELQSLNSEKSMRDVESKLKDGSTASKLITSENQPVISNGVSKTEPISFMEVKDNG